MAKRVKAPPDWATAPTAELTEVRVTPLDAAGEPAGPTVAYPLTGEPEGCLPVDGELDVTVYVPPDLPDDPTAELVLAHLAVHRANLDALQPMVDRETELRAQLWRVGRTLKPKLTQRQLAEASGVSDVAVAKKLGPGT